MRGDISLYLDLNEVFQSCKGGEYQISRGRIKLFCDFDIKFDFCLISTVFLTDLTKSSEEIFANGFFNRSHTVSTLKNIF